jgi:hypothetical protein
MVQPQVKLIAWTPRPDDVPWSTDADGGRPWQVRR